MLIISFWLTLLAKGIIKKILILSKNFVENFLFFLKTELTEPFLYGKRLIFKRNVQIQNLYITFYLFTVILSAAVIT